MAIDPISGIVGFIAGMVAAAIAIYKYLKSEISPSEAYVIFEKLRSVVETYNKAMEDGNLSTEEKLELARKTIAVIDEILKALE